MALSLAASALLIHTAQFRLFGCGARLC